MRLADWLEQTGVKRSAFARRIGVSAGYVTGLCNGSFWPGRRVAEAIERETEGSVTANDFVSAPEAA